MKFGLRTPSLKRRLSARTSVKRIVRHNLGFKMPRGGGFITNPKKAVYNRLYNRTSVSVDRILSKATSEASSGSGEAGEFFAKFLAFVFGFFGMAIGSFFTGLVFALIGFIIGFAISRKASSDAERTAQIAALTEAINGHIEMAQSGKTLTTRDKNCLQAIELLEALEQVQVDPTEKSKTRSHLVRIEASHKLLPVADLATKAERAKFKNQRKRALNYYLDALLECHNSKITDKDMALGRLKYGEASEPISLSWLESQAKKLGWQPPSDG